MYYVLIEVAEYEIHTPELFDNIEKAQDRMFFYIAQALDVDYEDVVNARMNNGVLIDEECFVSEMSAYRKTNDQNFAWKIFPLTELDEVTPDNFLALKELVAEMSGYFPACMDCKGKTESGARTEECVYELFTMKSVAHCAKQAIHNTARMMKENKDLKEQIARMKLEMPHMSCNGI